MVRSKGGVCIADEVQTGFGRLGSHYWGFESHDVMPDMGKDKIFRKGRLKNCIAKTEIIT